MASSIALWLRSGGSFLLLTISGVPHCALFGSQLLSHLCNQLSALNSPNDTVKFLFLNMSCDCSFLSTSYNHYLTYISFSLPFTWVIGLTFQTPLHHSPSLLINTRRLYVFSFFSSTSNKNNFQTCRSISHVVVKLDLLTL